MIFALLTLFAALGLATISEWFAIIGIMAIYAGAPIHALVMGIVLGSGKLVTTSWLYRNWGSTTWKMRVPLIFFTLTLMLTTSIGVFGFLSKAHLEQGASTVDNTDRIARLDQQILREKSVIDDNNKLITQMDSIINSYLGKDRTDRSLSVRKSQDPQRKQLRADIDASQKLIDQYSDEKLKLTSEIKKLQLDVGPIRYIAELIYGVDNNTDKNIESAVRIFTLIIVLTLDPLAVILLIAANHTLLRLRNEKEEDSSSTAGYNGRNIGMVPQPSDNEQSDGKESKDQSHRNNAVDETENRDDNIPSHFERTNTDEVHLPVLPEVVDILDEKENLKTVTVNQDSASFDKASWSSNQVGPDGGAADKKEEQEEEIRAALEKIIKIQKSGSSPAFVKSPSHSRVILSSNRDNIPVEPKPEDPPQPPDSTVDSWTAQSSTLRELMGSPPHFVPQKVNNEDKNIIKESLPQHPSTLSWITEFKRP